MKKIIIGFLFVMLWKPVFADDFNIENYVIENFYRGNALKHSESKDWGKVKYCKKYVAVANGGIDGSVYFLDKTNGQIISQCGGACWHPETDEQKNICKTMCPPPDMDCSGSCETWKCSITSNDGLSIKRLIGAGHDVKEVVIESQQEQAVHVASGAGYAETLKLLLENGADPNAKNAHGNTPLMLNLYENPNPKVVKLLIEAGADLKVEKDDGTWDAWNAINNSKGIVSNISKRSEINAIRTFLRDKVQEP